MIDGKARTAAATAKRTRTKHDRWIRELAGAGWSVVQAGHITVGATYAENLRCVYARCQRCDVEIFADFLESAVPLPRVLHAVTGHACIEGS